MDDSLDVGHAPLTRLAALACAALACGGGTVVNSVDISTAVDAISEGDAGAPDAPLDGALPDESEIPDGIVLAPPCPAGQTLCTAGCCPLVTLASGVQPTKVLVDAQSVFFLDAALAVRSVPLAPGAVSTIFTITNDACSHIEDFALGPSMVYLTMRCKLAGTPIPGKVLMVNKSGGGAQTILSNTVAQPEGIASDGQSIFWMDTYLVGTLDFAGLDGTGIGQILDFTHYQHGPITAASTGVYWITFAGDIHGVKGSGGSLRTVASGDSATVLASDASFVYWSGSGGAIRRAAPDGTMRSTLTSVGRPSSGIAVDARFVYVSDTAGARVLRVNLDGTGLTVLADGSGVFTAPTSLAVDDTSVYFCATGTVLRAPK